MGTRWSTLLPATRYPQKLDGPHYSRNQVPTGARRFTLLPQPWVPTGSTISACQSVCLTVFLSAGLSVCPSLCRSVVSLPNFEPYFSRISLSLYFCICLCLPFLRLKCVSLSLSLSLYIGIAALKITPFQVENCLSTLGKEINFPI